MPLCYFDTDAYRHVGTAFSDQQLEPALRQRILVSPITALEVMSQLTTRDRSEVLAQIHAMRNWLPEPARILQMPTYMIADRAFGKTIVDKMHTSITNSLDACFQNRDPDQLRQQAGRLRDYLDGWKADEAAILAEYQKESLADRLAGRGRPDRNRLIRAIREGLAMRAQVSPKATLVLGLRRMFSAFFEYEEERSFLIGTDPNYNPRSSKNINDAFDSEQLLFLCDSDRRFVTCDRKYARRVTRSRQAHQIVTLDPAELRDAQRATEALRRVIA